MSKAMNPMSKQAPAGAKKSYAGANPLKGVAKMSASQVNNPYKRAK